MVVKLDIAKVYDRLSWKFIPKCFIDLGFSVRRSNWIMECITTTSISVLVNGISGEQFKSKKGISREILISLYLYHLCGISWQYVLSMSTISKSSIGIKMAKNDSIIPYLIFADDCMIFYKATSSKARNVKVIWF